LSAAPGIPAVPIARFALPKGESSGDMLNPAIKYIGIAKRARKKMKNLFSY
jgi:hypothetical protein